MFFPGTGYGTIDGGTGQDTVNFSNVSNGVSGSLYTSHPIYDLVGGLGVISVNGSGLLVKNVEHVIGSPFNDTISGDDGDNMLLGSHGSDVLNGKVGNDLLVAGGGSDSLTGGDGADVFELTDRDSTVTITDYHFSQGDRIELDVKALGLAANANLSNYVQYDLSLIHI